MSNLLIKSLNLGLIDSVLNWLIGALTSLFQWLINFAIDLIVLIFAEVLYSIGLTLLSLVDFFQAFFNALCGLGTYYDSGVAVQGDPILTLITNKAVLQVFLALTIVAAIMLILTTIIAMVRTEFTTEGAKNTKGNIIGSALKSLAMFFVVPAACVFGIILSSGLLKAVYNATSGGDGVTAGAMVWYASSYNANRVRLESEGNTIVTPITFYEDNWLNSSNSKWAADFNINQGSDSERREAVANAIDNAFKNETEIGSQGPRGIGTISYSFTDLMEGDFSAFDEDEKRVNYYSYRNVILTEAYYSIRSMNFITMFLGGGIAVYIMFIAAFGLIIRLYKCAVLFMISAPITALTPLDGGAAYKNWRKIMVGSVLSAFSVVVAFNLIFLLIPIVSNINIFKPSGFTAVWNRLVSLIFVLTGLYSIKETSKWVASMLGIEDPLAAGSEIAGKVMGTVGKVGTFAGSVVGGTVAKSIGAGMRKNADKALSDAMEMEGPLKDEKGKLTAKGLAMQKAKDASDKADKVTGVGNKIAGAGREVIGKTITKNFNRLDDFLGGSGVFGGPDGGVGKFLSDKSGKLYGKGVNITSGIMSGGRLGTTEARKRFAVTLGGNEADTNEYNENTRRIKSNNSRLDQLTSKENQSIKYGTPGLTDSELEERQRLEQDNAERQDRNNKIYDKYKGNMKKVGHNYVTGDNQAAKLAGQYLDNIANFNDVVNKTTDHGDLIEKNVTDALKTIQMYGVTQGEKGGIKSETAGGKQALQEQARNLAEMLGMSIKEVMNSLLGKDAGKNLIEEGKKPLKALDEYSKHHDVGLEGLKVDVMMKDETSKHGAQIAEQIRKAMESVLNNSGSTGTDLEQQLSKNLQRIKEQQARDAAEAKKEREKITELAVAIAKNMKKFNPPKK